MSILLTQGNLPPLSPESSLDAQIRGSTQGGMIAQTHELWSNAGHSLGGITYATTTFSTSNLAYTKIPTSAVLPLSSYSPLLDASHVRDNGEVVVRFWAFVQNAQVQFSVRDFEYGVLIQNNAAAVSGTWQWVTGTLIIPLVTLNLYGPRLVGAFEIRRLTFTGTGTLRQISAKVLYRTATDIPR